MPNPMHNAKLETQIADSLLALFPSYSVVVVVKVDVSRAEAVPANKLFVAWRPLVLGVPRKHALDTHAYALDVLYRAPSLVAE